MYFDWKQLASDAGLTTEQVDALVARVRADFPDDPMMFDLHMLRACNAIRDGRVTAAQAGFAEHRDHAAPPA